MHSCFDGLRFLRVDQRNWGREWRFEIVIFIQVSCCIRVYSDSVLRYQSLHCVGRLEWKTHVGVHTHARTHTHIYTAL